MLTKAGNGFSDLCGVRAKTYLFDEPTLYPQGADIFLSGACKPTMSGIQNPGIRHPLSTAGSQKAPKRHRWRSFLRACQAMPGAALLFFYQFSRSSFVSIEAWAINPWPAASDPARRQINFTLDNVRSMQALCVSCKVRGTLQLQSPPILLAAFTVFHQVSLTIQTAWRHLVYDEIVIANIYSTGTYALEPANPIKKCGWVSASEKDDRKTI